MRLLISIFLFFCLPISFATDLHSITVFGDSLSDTGNLYEFMQHQLPQSPPYYTGHFSNGPVWVEHLMKKYYYEKPEKYILNYAFGGAGILSDEEEEDDIFFTLKKEIDTYLLAHNDQADPDSMFVIWIGGNNYLEIPDNPEEITNQVMHGIEKGIERLISAGAKNFTLINLPDLKNTPLAIELESKDMFGVVSEMHNTKLLQLSEQLQAKYPQVHFIHFDANHLFQMVLDEPQKFDFIYTDKTCYDNFIPNKKPTLLKMVANVRAKKGSEASTNCDSYIFFDLIHPTTRVHALLAKYMQEAYIRDEIYFH